MRPGTRSLWYSGFLRGVFHDPACTLRSGFFFSDRGRDAAAEYIVFETGFLKRNAMGAVFACPVPWEAEAVL